ncbi:tetratricopeptide repeat protein [Desulfovibrio ferrophilus]|uniref:Diguanylate cyclase and serine/threonine protein kinase with TPR repeats n=1 Tax=Desulfovibrio ferrophilus TaxID=241368 RepID=A0A2Z6B3E1_9BACT|nr:tetratricopeptide repeat protein [Desulfovibrio ferrophilus]BBD09958.1 diguanylate cyclase and serine/threonine protein kinase with TPR repeats [Desulfovibrio ferrophilus]
MKAHKSLLPDDGPQLTRSDLITYEHLLRDEISSFLPFTSYSLFFPRSLDSGALSELVEGRAVFLPEEKKALLPLALNGELMGVFVAKGVKLQAPKAMPPLLASMARMCLEKLQLYKISVTDSGTGLGTRELLSRAAADEIERVQGCLRPDADGCRAGDSGFAASFGLILARLHDLERNAETYGPAFATRALNKAAAIVNDIAPQGALTARAGDDSLVILLPAVTPPACRKLAGTLAAELSALQVKDPVLECYLHPGTSVGCASYPHDVNGHVLRQKPTDQAALLVRKAMRAARAAAQNGTGRAFAYSQIVTEGGHVQEVLPLGRLTVDLGASVGAREGQRFLVWGGTNDPKGAPTCKGEIALMEVRRGHSLAEVMHQADVSLNVEPGDRLALIQETDPAENGGKADADMLTGLPTYRDFLKQLVTERDKHETFSLVLLRLPDMDRPSDSLTETRLRDLASACTKIFGESALGGRTSLSGLAWLLPETSGPKAKKLCEKLLESLPPDFPRPAAGITKHPFLSYSKADALDNAHKALEYAILLPEPHIGLVDSLALNIHADKLFAQGSLYDAIEEYKLALTADRSNIMARNSLGVCHARMGDLSAAKRQFNTVLGKNPKDVFALYNFGYICQRMNQIKEAREAYKKCLILDPEHLFSQIRLGQLSQKNRRFADARRYFEKASALPGGKGLTRRYLAQLALAKGDVEEAREHLHQALIHDPKDAPSLALMARIYLDNGEDPEVAEALARQASALAPGHAPFWKELARALSAQGKQQEAAEVVDRLEGM